MNHLALTADFMHGVTMLRSLLLVISTYIKPTLAFLAKLRQNTEARHGSKTTMISTQLTRLLLLLAFGITDNIVLREKEDRYVMLPKGYQSTAHSPGALLCDGGTR